MRIVSAADGFARNPLDNSTWRNKPCPCTSGKKTKKCCGRFTFIPEADAKRIYEAAGLKAMEKENVK